MKYRIYASGNVIDEDSFSEYDNAVPYYDDYQTIEVPNVLVEYIQSTV